MDAQAQDRYRLETARLVARRGRYGVLLFLGGVGLAGVLEYGYHPERLLYLLLFFALELAICVASSASFRSQRGRRAALGLTYLTSAALIVCVTGYGLLTGTSVAVMAFLFVVFELTTALVFPWNARSQALMAATCFLLYATLLAGETTTGVAASNAALPVAYALYAVAAGGLVSVLGAAFLDRQRFTQFTQREQLDKHLLTFRELTRAFRGFDPQRVVFLACRAALQTFGLQRLWVIWQTVGTGAHGYVVRQQHAALDWEALADAQTLWRWIADWEADGRAFVMRADDPHVPISLERAKARSLLCIPLLFEGERLGAICGDRNGSPFALGERELALGSVLANAVSIALVNAQLYQRAAAASEEKSIFLARIAHELRNPLQALLWDLDTVRNEPAGHRSELDRVEQNALMTLDLAKELQDFAEVETRRLVATPEPVNVIQALDHLEATALGLIGDRPIEYRTHVAPGAEVAVTDPIRLRQIVGNLVSNAVKFTTHGSIDVEARRAGAEIAISVRDTGVGIPEPELASIFSPFYRGTARAHVRAHGMGLGLAIARDLATLLGGRIEVESTAGAGSTFRFMLPGASGEIPALGHAVAEMHGAIVLLVDDDEHCRSAIATALRHSGAKVIEAAGGAAGLQRARDVEPDAIVLDLGLPDMSGIDVLQQVKADAALARIPVVVATAEQGVGIEPRCRALGCAGFVVKPCPAEQLVAILAPLIRRMAPSRGDLGGELALPAD